LDVALLSVLFFLAAVLYSSVGQAGGTAYLAVMAFMGVSTAVMKPTALVLNVLVATIATVRYVRAGRFSWRSWWPFAAGSAPLAFTGGWWQLGERTFGLIAGVILLITAVRFAWRTTPVLAAVRPPPVPLGMLSGAAIGLLAGLTGTGGGVFLTPLMLMMGWSNVRDAAGVSAAFILVNSMAGLAGNYANVGSLPPYLWLWAAVVGVGAMIGTELGSRRLSPPMLQRVLACVLAIAGLKLLLG
jgi:uncharacterized membrane protein YfcA